MPIVAFHRSFRRFTGGHLKVWDYFNHVRSADGFRPSIHLAPGSVRDATNPWMQALEYESAVWPPVDADILFLAGKDWDTLPTAEHETGRRPIINLVQHVRHADPADPRAAFLAHRAVRICVSEEVAEAVRGTGRANGPVFAIANGIDLGALPEAGPEDERRYDLVIVGIKQRRAARALFEELGPRRGNVHLIDAPLPRDEFLRALASARCAVFMPNETEGFYLPALEAMALGTLVVCPDCVGNRSFCLPDETALMPAARHDALLAAAREALELPLPRRSSILESAHAKARELTLERERSAFLDVLHRLPDLWLHDLR